MTFSQFLSVVEIRTKLISLSTFLLATVAAISEGEQIHVGSTVLLLTAVLAVDMGTTAFNSFYDFVRGVDVPGFSMEPEKVLVHEGVAPGHALIVSVSLYALAAVAGLFVALQSSLWIVPVGISCMAVGFLYNGGPLPISRTPVGELFAGGFLGTVLFLVVAFVHSDEVTRQALITSIPSTLIIASVLTVNNTCDVEGDRAAGRRTLSVLLGPGPGSFVVDALVVAGFAFAGTAILGTAGAGNPTPLVVLVSGLALALWILVQMHLRGYSHKTKRPNMLGILRVVLVFTVTYGVALLLA